MEEEKIEVLDKISKAFIEFQKEMPEVKLDSTVKVKTKTGGEYKFKYATLGNILKKALPVLTSKGLGITQKFAGDALKTILLHESGQFWESDITLDLHSGTMQEVGSRISYLKRYEVSAMLGIVAEEDDDANIASGNDYKHEGKDKTALKEPQPKGSAAKPLPQGQESEGLKITKVILKEDVGKDGKPYKLYTIVDNNNNKYATFSDTFAGIAKEARDKGLAVKIESEKGKFGLDLISIEKVSSDETPQEKDNILDLLRSLAREPEHVDAMCIEGIGKKATDDWTAEDIDRMQGYIGLFEKTKEAA